MELLQAGREAGYGFILQRQAEVAWSVEIQVERKDGTRDLSRSSTTVVPQDTFSFVYGFLAPHLLEDMRDSSQNPSTNEGIQPVSFVHLTERKK